MEGRAPSGTYSEMIIFSDSENDLGQQRKNNSFRNLDLLGWCLVIV